MLSFTSSLDAEVESFAIFVSEKYEYKDRGKILPNHLAQKINSFLSVLKVKNKDEEISSFDISNQQKCFIIKVKKKYENSYPQESGGIFYSHLKKFKNLNSISFCVDTLHLGKEELIESLSNISLSSSDFIILLNIFRLPFDIFKNSSSFNFFS